MEVLEAKTSIARRGSRTPRVTHLRFPQQILGGSVGS